MDHPDADHDPGTLDVLLVVQCRNINQSDGFRTSKVLEQPDKSDQKYSKLQWTNFYINLI